MPRCPAPASGWPYPRFSSNYARFAAQEITKQRDTEGFTKHGFLLQVVAAGWHHKSAAQLRDLGDRVGRERIFVLHGTVDKIISIPHGRKLIEYLNPGKSIIVDGMGRKYYTSLQFFWGVFFLPIWPKLETTVTSRLLFFKRRFTPQLYG